MKLVWIYQYPLLKAFFYKNAPLHDGAAIIENNTITATRVVLPVSEKNKHTKNDLDCDTELHWEFPKKTDALVLAISEETGALSYFKNGEKVFLYFLQRIKRNDCQRHGLNRLCHF